MPGRRSFLIGCGGMVAAPALAHLGLSLPETRPLQSTTPEASASTALADLASPYDAVLRVDGWDTPDASATHSEMWVHINSSWKAAWR